MTNTYSKIEADNFLSGKQATLSAATTLLGTGGSITGISHLNFINKPDLPVYALSSLLSSYLTISSASSTYQPTLTFNSSMTKNRSNCKY
jgi:hypothetical protein